MKLKKRVIIIFFVILFIFLIGIYLYKNNDIVYNVVTSESKKHYVSNKDFVPNKEKECNLYNEDYSDKNTILTTDEGNTIYVVHGCAWDYRHIIQMNINSDSNKLYHKIDDDFKRKVCQTQREIVNVYDEVSVKDFNNSGCLSYVPKVELKKLSVECNDFGIKDTGNYDVKKFEYDSSKICLTDSNTLKGQTGILAPSAVNSNYPVYLVQGCAWDISDIVVNKEGNECVTEEFKQKACSTYRDYTETNLASSTLVSDYNESCKDFTGELETKYDGMSCEKAKDLITNYYVDYTDLYDWYINSSRGNCGSLNIEDFNKNNYNLEDGNCERHRIYNKNATDISNIGFTGILRRSLYNSHNNGYENACDYPLFYVNGYATTLDDYKNKADNDLEDVKAFCDDLYNEVLDYVSSNNVTDYHASYYEYDLVCIQNGIMTDKIEPPEFSGETGEYVDIVFKPNNSYGMSCNEYEENGVRSFTSKENECTYRVDRTKIIDGKVYIKELPNDAELVQETGAKFVGWRKSDESSCDYFKYNSVVSGITLEDTEIVFYACFEETSIENSTEYTLYNDCDGKAKDQNNNPRSADVANKAMLDSNVTSNKTSKVSNSSGLRLISDKVGDFQINNYCFVSCTEKFQYSYPTIFETVKSGTYFDLLNYPRIVSSLQCVETFNHKSWEYNYEASIVDEKEAWIDYANYEAAEGLSSFENSWTQCSSKCTSRNENGRCTSRKRWYYYEATGTFYELDSENNVISEEKTYRYCSRYENADDARKQAKKDHYVTNEVEGYYEKKYDNAKNDREAMEKANKVCHNALFKSDNNDVYSISNPAVKVTIENTDKFYYNDAVINFYYESDYSSGVDDLGLNGYVQEELKATNVYVKDSNVHSWEMDSIDYENENLEHKISYGSNEYYFYEKKMVLNKDGYVNLVRTVYRNYTFDKSDSHSEYCSLNQSGEIKTVASGECSDTNSIYLGYVYPVRLDLNGIRNVYFSIKVDTNLSYGSKNILTKAASISDNTVYRCDYEISNDIITEDKTTSKKEDYKKNFYVRSIATQNVDPNDRLLNGTFGANWSDEKGKALIDIIESKSKGNNTYNPENLEYSFTLNAQTIEAIREYNIDNKYDDFNLKCNDMGGECESKFLNELAGKNDSNKNRVGSKEVKIDNVVMDRKSWKYYIDDPKNKTDDNSDNWYKTSKLTGTTNWKKIKDGSSVTYSTLLDGCKGKGNSKLTYDCIYRNINEGVLP